MSARTEERLGGLEVDVADIKLTLARIEATLAASLPHLATKAELDQAIAGVAKNVDITALGRDVRELRDEVRMTAAIVLRLDHMWPDVIEQLGAMVRLPHRILDRLRDAEEGGKPMPRDQRVDARANVLLLQREPDATHQRGSPQ